MVTVNFISERISIDVRQEESFADKRVCLEVIEKEILDSLSDSKDSIREMCIYILNAGGKRIRPLLVLYCGLAFSDMSSGLTNAAVAAELIHMATLIHDDIIDNSGLRRCRPSINVVWGNHYGVLCGDYLFSKAFRILSEHRLYKSLDLMIEAIDGMCNGEILQANNRFNLNMDLKTYYHQITGKTAVFIKNCCKSGACIAGVEGIQMEAVGEYGLHLGLAFQMIDDCLDFSGSVTDTGKPKHEDLRDGVFTLPIILLLENEKYGPIARKILCRGELTARDIDAISEMIHSSGVMKESYQVASRHIDKAKQCLEVLPETYYRDTLCSLSDMLRTRSS